MTQELLFKEVSYPAYFVGDVNDGYELECQNCLRIHEYLNKEKWVCKTCDSDLHYPEGASW